ncbi:hypothetical protein K457DRAFT_131069 [Linnemannia elongata AG-77]|uniref:Uncharacterized protein n=1 Tax=Linnemannia elongata AG-77 TaxID=1314771 RepID=A0A197JCA7_9FUNG|nr:hypothetical protein K457DRAFT_131069 [Linnemannia elongata AG-77]
MSITYCVTTVNSPFAVSSSVLRFISTYVLAEVRLQRRKKEERIKTVSHCDHQLGSLLNDNPLCPDFNAGTGLTDEDIPVVIDSFDLACVLHQGYVFTDRIFTKSNAQHKEHTKGRHQTATQGTYQGTHQGTPSRDTIKGHHQGTPSRDTIKGHHQETPARDT